MKLKNCCRRFKTEVLLKLLEKDNNWDYTISMLSPFLQKETQLRESGIEEDY